VTNAQPPDPSGCAEPGCRYADESAFESWRDAFERLRAEERAFVQAWLHGDRGAEASSRYVQLEALRQATTRKFESAQLTRRERQGRRTA
jgi:hypothetical protein